MSVEGYLGNQLGDHVEHDLRLAWYPAAGRPESVCVECEGCGEVVAELYNADAEPGPYDSLRTDCPVCGHDDLRVVEVTLTGTGEKIHPFSRLHPDGFELPDGVHGSTEDERVRCRSCDTTILLSQLTL